MDRKHEKIVHRLDPKALLAPVARGQEVVPLRNRKFQPTPSRISASQKWMNSVLIYAHHRVRGVKQDWQHIPESGRRRAHSNWQLGWAGNKRLYQLAVTDSTGPL